MTGPQALESTLKLSKSDQTRQRCLTAAVRILSSQGLAELKYESVAREAGVTRPLVKKYYPEKTQIVMEAAALVRKGYQEETIAAMRQNHGQPVLQLRMYIKKMLALPRENRAATGIWLCSLHVAHLNKESRKMNTEMVRMGHERILALLSLCPFDPTPQADRVESLARSIQAMLTAAVLKALTEDLPGPNEDYEQNVAEDCFRLLRSEGLQGL